MGRMDLKRAGGRAKSFEAYTLGFQLAVPIVIGAALGQWLDTRYHTSFWMPILALIGIVVGFSELFRSVAKINRRNAEEKAAADASTAATRDLFSRSGTADETRASEVASDEVEEERVKPRYFAVPPPPTASFETGRTAAPRMGQRRVETEPDSETDSEQAKEDVLKEWLPDDSDKPSST